MGGLADSQVGLMNDEEIAAAQRIGLITITPFSPNDIQPASLDIHVGRKFRVFTSHHNYIDPAVEQPNLTQQVIVEPGGFFTLESGQFVLASTFEHIKLSARVGAELMGKSSLGRLGLMVHSTAGWIDPGFNGHITLEMSNQTHLPIRIYPGMKIGQLCFNRISRCKQAYGENGRNKYQNQEDGPKESRSFVNWSTLDVFKKE